MVTGVEACTAAGNFGSGVAAALQFFAAAQCMLTGEWPQQADVTNGSSFDFIVVGGGTAGAALAARLSEMNQFTVLLLEAGGDPPQDSIVPVYKDVFKNSPYDWNFTTIDDGYTSQALINGQQKQPRGKMLGGSGSINDMVYARGFPSDYEEWATFLGPEWNWPTVLNYFKKTEDMIDENIINIPELMRYHAKGGPIRVSGTSATSPSIDTFLNAFEEIGFKRVQDMTYPHLIGVGKFSHTIRDGQRDSSVTGLLNKAAQTNKNLYVLKNILVTKILMDGNKATGITAVNLEQETLHFFARQEVILSAGTFNTPKLLLLSGIGPKYHLDEIGIKTVVDLPVGDNLHDQVMVPTYIAVDKGTCPTNETKNNMETIRYLFDRTGDLSTTNSIGAYYVLKNTQNKNVPDFGIYPSCIPAGSQFALGCKYVLGYKDEICDKLEEANKDKELMSFVLVLLKPKSRGYLRLKSKNPMDPPLIYSGTFNNSEDLNNFPEAILSTIALATTTYFSGLNAEIVQPELASCGGLSEWQGWKCYALKMALGAWHGCGSAALGSVLTPTFKVKNVIGLRVVDASAMPKVIRGNTNAPVVMFAERAADFIKKDYETPLATHSGGYHTITNFEGNNDTEGSEQQKQMQEQDRIEFQENATNHILEFIMSRRIPIQ